MGGGGVALQAESVRGTVAGWLKCRPHMKELARNSGKYFEIVVGPILYKFSFCFVVLF